MALGFALGGAAMFLLAAWLSEKHALYLPAVVLIAAAVANTFLKG
jgi:hypothetical protein